MNELTDQPTLAPTRKVTAHGAAGTLLILVGLGLRIFNVEFELSLDEAAALVTAWTWCAAYFARERA